MIGKVEKDIEIQTPAATLYKIFKSQCHHIPNMAKSFHAVDVHEGDWEKEGSIKHWKYNIGTLTQIHKYLYNTFCFSWSLINLPIVWEEGK